MEKQIIYENYESPGYETTIVIITHPDSHKEMCTWLSAYRNTPIVVSVNLPDNPTSAQINDAKQEIFRKIYKEESLIDKLIDDRDDC